MLLSLGKVSQNFCSTHMVTSTEDFNALLDKRSGNVIVKFFATWCKPCKNLSLTLEKSIIPKYKNRVTFIDVDIQACPELKTFYGIKMIPTMIFFKNNTVIKSIQNSKISVEELSKEIDEQFHL